MSRAAVTSRNTISSRNTVALTQNLLFPSEPTQLADLYAKFNVAIVDYVWLKDGEFAATKAVQFGNNSVVRYAYQSFTPQTLRKVHALSVYVTMDDGNAPIANDQTAASDFMLCFSNSPVIGKVTRVRDTSAYRVTYKGNFFALNGNLFGVVKYAGNSARGFKISGYQLNDGPIIAPYKKTILAPYDVGAIRAAIAQEQNRISNSNRPDLSPWSRGTGVTCTPNTNETDDPRNKGLFNANKIVYNGSGAPNSYKIATVTGPLGAVKEPQTLTVWLKMASESRNFVLGNNSGPYMSLAVTNAWQQFELHFPAVKDNFISTFSLYDAGDNSPFTMYMYTAGAVDGNVKGPDVITGALAGNNGPMRNIIT